MQKVRHTKNRVAAKVVHNFRTQNAKVFPHGTRPLSVQQKSLDFEGGAPKKFKQSFTINAILFRRATALPAKLIKKTP